MLDRKSLLGLREPRWVDLLKNRGFRVQIIPAALDETKWNVISDRAVEDICREAFVDFEGYVDNGEPVPNSLEARKELYSDPSIRTLIRAAFLAESDKVVNDEAGEADAAAG